MKNKKMTYVLGAAVLLVWGLILYRVFAALSADDDNPETAAVAIHPTKEPLNDYALIKDTSRLLLNYSDPFRMEKPKDTSRVIPVKTLIAHDNALKRNVPLIQKTNWSQFKYTGYVRNPRTKKLIALISYNGRSMMLAEGETSGEIKLLKNLKDSVKIAYNGMTRFISMNNTP